MTARQRFTPQRSEGASKTFSISCRRARHRRHRHKCGAGYGATTISDNDATAGNVDTLSFGAGISDENLWFAQSGNDLIVSVFGTTDSVKVSDWYSGSDYGFNPTTATTMPTDSTLQSAIVAAWH